MVESYNGKQKIDSEELERAAPKGTPPIFLGLAFLLSSLPIVYIAVAPEIRSFIDARRVANTEQLNASLKLSENSNSAVLEVVNTFSLQIASLSKEVGAVKAENSELKIESAALRRDVEALKRESDRCIAELAVCRSAGKSFDALEKKARAGS